MGISGFLMKEGGKIKHWKRRWCVLRGHKLFYAESEVAFQVGPKGFLDVDAASSVNRLAERAGHENYFEVVTNSRIWCFSAPTTEEKDRWVGEIERIIFQVRTEMRGFMYKEGGSHKSWKKRFFVCKQGTLVYYDDEGGTEKGRIAAAKATRIDDAATRSGKEHYFEIVTKERTWALHCQSAQDKEKWVAWLRSVAAEAALDDGPLWHHF